MCESTSSFIVKMRSSHVALSLLILGANDAILSGVEIVLAVWTLADVVGVQEVRLERLQALKELCAVDAVEGVRVVRTERVLPLRLGQFVSVRGRDAVVDAALVFHAVSGVPEGLRAAEEAAAEELQQVVRPQVSDHVRLHQTTHRTVVVRDEHVLGQQQVRVGHLGTEETRRQAAWQPLEASRTQTQRLGQLLGRLGHLVRGHLHPRVSRDHDARVCAVLLLLNATHGHLTHHLDTHLQQKKQILTYTDIIERQNV